jgi:hypothetical protein
MYEDDWEKRPFSLLGGHGHKEDSLLGSHKMDGVN